MTTDNFPLDADYPLQIPYQGNVLVSTMKGGKQYRRLTGPPVRTWRLTFASRPVTDWDTLEQFYRKVLDDFFTWTDPIRGRSYSVFFGSDPQFEPAANQSVHITLDLVEAVGVPLATYPTAPVIAMALSRLVTIGNSVIAVYGGYGATYAGTGLSDITVDGVSVGLGGAGTLTGISLGLHRVVFVGSGSPPTMTSFGFVE